MARMQYSISMVMLYHAPVSMMYLIGPSSKLLAMPIQLLALEEVCVHLTTLGYSYDSYSYCSLVQPFVAPVAVKRRGLQGNDIHGVALGEQGSHNVYNVEIGPVGELV